MCNCPGPANTQAQPTPPSQKTAFFFLPFPKKVHGHGREWGGMESAEQRGLHSTYSPLLAFLLFARAAFSGGRPPEGTPYGLIILLYLIPQPTLQGLAHGKGITPI